MRPSSLFHVRPSQLAAIDPVNGTSVDQHHREDYEATAREPELKRRHWLAELLSRPGTAILAVTILVGQTGCEQTEYLFLVSSQGVDNDSGG